MWRKNSMQIFYTVRTGDTLYNIAARWYIPLPSLIASNNLSWPYIISSGDQLSMPPGVTTYVVKPGDSVYSISQGYRIPINIIIEGNGLVHPYIITPGMVLSVPSGAPFYVVRPGDTLYKIAAKYNVMLNGRPRPDLIIEANKGITTTIFPGMALSIPYPPPGGQGILATVLSDGFQDFIGLSEPTSGKTSTIAIDYSGRSSTIFWSPNGKKLAYAGNSGIISIIDVATGKISKIDQITTPAYMDWSYESNNLVYSTGSLIRIYDVLSNTFRTIYRSGASYVQWFPKDKELLYEAKDASGLSQLYRSSIDGSNERKLTNNLSGPFNEVRLSPNGNYVLYTSPGVSISEIYTLELVTNTLYKIPGGPEGKNYYPTWSPDSSRIAYSSTHFRNGKYYSLIRVSGAKGENDSTIAISSCYATPVTWSPDNNKLAYLSGCREDNLAVEVWSLELRKPVPINVLFGFFFYNLDWSLSR